MSAFREKLAREKEAREKAAQEDYDYACERFGSEEALAGDDLVKVARVRAQFNAWKRNWRLDYELDSDEGNDFHVVAEEEKLWMEEKLWVKRQEAIDRYLEAPDTNLNDNAQFMRYMEPYRFPYEKTTENWINIKDWIQPNTKYHKRRLKVGYEAWSNIINTSLIVSGIFSSFIVEPWLVTVIIFAFVAWNVILGNCRACLLQRTKIKFSRIAMSLALVWEGLSIYCIAMLFIEIF